MTAQELIAKVLELDATATKGPWREDNDDVICFIESQGEECILVEGGFGFADTPDYRLIAHYRTAAPILARMLQKAIEQRDCEIWDTEGDRTKEKYDAELDRIAKGEE